MASDDAICQLKVTLLGIKPAIWRRVLVPATYTLKDLHDVLQGAFGWTDSHLHQFVVRNTYYGIPDPDFEMEQVDEKRVRIDDVLKFEKSSMVYEYDFGDGWEHKVILEKIIENPGGQLTPICVDGARACPPDDCGGVYGYENLLAAISNPALSEHKEILEWIGGHFDSERFNTGEINRRLSLIRRKGLKSAPSGDTRKGAGAKRSRNFERREV